MKRLLAQTIHHYYDYDYYYYHESEIVIHHFKNQVFVIFKRIMLCVVKSLRLQILTFEE